MAAIELPAGTTARTDVEELTFVGTATVLLRVAGFTVLTDPNFLHAGERAYLGKGLSSRRLTEPALQPADLPPLDLVVLSHHHGDHFDRIAAAELDKDLPIVTEPHSARQLARQGFRRPVALQTWESQVFRRGDTQLTITSLPGRHAPRAFGWMAPPVMGSMLDVEEDGRRLMRIYITGDTLMHDRIHEIPQRYPDIDLGLVHLGGTRVAGVLLTMDGAQGVQLLQVVRPRTAVPIHYDDYTVFKSPLQDFQHELSRAEDLATEVRYVGRGETVPLPVR